LEVSTYSMSQEDSERDKRARDVRAYLYSTVVNRWQILGENFVPVTRLSHREGGDIYRLEADAHNTLVILNFMREVHKELYAALNDDLSWLLSHVQETTVNVSRSTGDMELFIYENARNGKLARTISSGTLRCLAMLTAVYALDMPQQEELIRETKPLTPSAPGLIAIEEPDTALNPDILDKFVELLRTYTTRADRPRQFILTTHNPAFLDYFEPDEVRIVERDADGYTSVRPIDDDVRKTLLTKYTLGEVWKMRALGAIPDA